MAKQAKSLACLHANPLLGCIVQYTLWNDKVTKCVSWHLTNSACMGNYMNIAICYWKCIPWQLVVWIRPPTDFMAQGGLSNAQDTKMCYGLFQTGCLSSDRRKYSGSLLWDVVVTSLMIMGRTPVWLSALLIPTNTLHTTICCWLNFCLL
jgi:hypothetical protein